MDQKRNNVALWIFPNFRETINSIPAKYRGRAWEVLIEKAYGNSIELQKEKIFVQCAVNSLLPLIKLRNTGGSKNGESNNPSGRRKVQEEQRTTLAPTVAPTLTKTLAPTVAPTVAPTLLYNNNNNNNINNTTTKSLFSDVVEKPAKKEKAKNPLQIFSNEVIKNFEPDVKTDSQIGVWFRRNCRNLRDILTFCEGDIPLALRTIDVCIRWLDERKLTGGYEAVLRHIPEFCATAKKELEVENAQTNRAEQ